MRTQLVLLTALGVAVACYPDKRNPSTRVDAAPPDLKQTPDLPQLDGKPDRSTVDVGVDAFAPATCDKTATCTTSADCKPTESCARLKKIYDWCAPTCGPDPGKGGDCANKPITAVNPFDNGQSSICLASAGCTAIDFSSCPPGTVCQHTFGGTLCALPGENDLGQKCITMTWDDVTNGCKAPYLCVPKGLGQEGICRKGCDSWPGGPATATCGPTEECVNFKAMLGFDDGACCATGTNCAQ